jgi:hypothetical protein
MTVIYELNHITKTIFQGVNSFQEMKEAHETYFSFMRDKHKVDIEKNYAYLCVNNINNNEYISETKYRLCKSKIISR